LNSFDFWTFSEDLNQLKIYKGIKRAMGHICSRPSLHRVFVAQGHAGQKVLAGQRRWAAMVLSKTARPAVCCAPMTLDGGYDAPAAEELRSTDGQVQLSPTDGVVTGNGNGG
jgi:hypothetical protein